MEREEMPTIRVLRNLYMQASLGKCDLDLIVFGLREKKMQQPYVHSIFNAAIVQEMLR